MTTFRMADTELEESPPTIAYALIVLATAIYDFSIVIEDDKYLAIVDDDSGMVLARLEIDPAFGPLMMAILHTTGEELSDGAAWSPLNN